MASSSGEITQSPGQIDEGGKVTIDEGREGKKKKFRPFEAVRKFFKGGKKGNKSESRSQSRSLQMINAEDSDDDGGFRRRHRMGECRSMSEDSVFHPEVKETKHMGIRKTAISTESLHIDFKSELERKLKKRYSRDLNSSDDEALPKSPTPPVDMGSDFKSLPGKFDRGSDISIDTSEIEEDDIFKTDWRKSVASVSERKSSVQSLPDSVDMDLDLSAIGKDTVTLKNDAARHRISVKRNISKRRPSGPRKTREPNLTTTSPLPQVKEESPIKSDAQISPIIPEPLSTKSPTSPISPKPTKADLPLSPVTRESSLPKSPVSPKPLSPKPVFTKQDLFSQHIEKVGPSAKDPALNVPDTRKSVDSDLRKRLDENKTMISVGNESDMKKSTQSAKFKSMSLDRKENYCLSDYSKASLDKKDNTVSDFSKSPSHGIGQIAKLSRQRPKSLHDSSLPASTSEEDSELSRTFSKLKKNSAKEAESASDTKRDTGFVLVGSIKNKDRDIPFGARRPETNTLSTSFNEGKTTKPETTPLTTQAPDLVKPDQSPTKTNFTYVLKKEPLKSQSSISLDRKDIKPLFTTESKLEKSEKDTVQSEKKQETNDLIPDTEGADFKQTKDQKSNYENVTLNFESKAKNNEMKDSDKSDKIVIISSDDKTEKGPSSGYDNAIISSNESPNKLASPREDYKLKRQSRSRTLPEQPVTADILNANKSSSIRKDSLTQSFKFKASETIPEKAESKSLDTRTKMFSSSMKSTSSSTSTTPTWMLMAKKKQEEAKEKEAELAKGTESNTALSKNTSVLDSKDKFTPKSVFSSGSSAEKNIDTKNRFKSKSVYNSGTKPEPAKDQQSTKKLEPDGFKITTRTSFRDRGSTLPSSEISKDIKPGISGSKDSKTEEKFEEKKTAASLAKSFESKSSTTGRNVSLDSPKGWKPPSSKVKIEIIEKTDTNKAEQSSKPASTRTTTAKKLEEKSPLKNVPEKCVDKKSKVLDMVKNFQNLEVS